MSRLGLCMKENIHTYELIVGSEKALHIAVWDRELKFQWQLLSCKGNKKFVQNHSLFAKAFFNLLFGLMTAIIVTCLTYILRWLQLRGSYLPQLSTVSEGGSRRGLRHFCQPLSMVVPCRGKINSSFLSPRVLWAESKSALPTAFNTTGGVWLHLILRSLRNLRLSIRRSLRVLP